jgi:hypothetical protein
MSSAKCARDGYRFLSSLCMCKDDDVSTQHQCIVKMNKLL